MNIGMYMKKQHMLFIFILSALLSFNVFALPPQIEADRQLIAAKQAIAKGDFNSALKNFQKIESLNVQMPIEFWYHYGKVLLETGDYKGAMGKIDHYVTATGQGGEYYPQALEIYNKAESLPAIIRAEKKKQREKELAEERERERAQKQSVREFSEQLDRIAEEAEALKEANRIAEPKIRACQNMGYTRAYCEGVYR